MLENKLGKIWFRSLLTAVFCAGLLSLSAAERGDGGRVQRSSDTGVSAEASGSRVSAEASREDDAAQNDKEAGGNRVSGTSRNRKLNPNLNLLSPGSIGRSKFPRLDRFELSVSSLENSVLSAAQSRTGGSAQISMTKRLNAMTVEARAIQQQLRTPQSRRIDLAGGLSLIQQGYDYLKDGKNRGKRGMSFKKTDYRNFIRQHRRDLESLLKDGASTEEYARSEEQLYQEWLSGVVEANLRKCDSVKNQNTREAYENIIHGFARLRTAIRKIKQSGVKIQEKQ